MLEFSDIHKSFKNKKVLEGITSKIQPGEFVGVVGCSGAGKSTLARILAGLESPDKGFVAVDGSPKVALGSNLMSDDLVAYRRSVIGYVSQEVNLFAWMTVREQLLIAPTHVCGFELDRVNQQLDDLATQLNCHELLLERPNVLSGGEVRRFGLIRALLLNPKYLILDEVTNGLDPQLIVKISEVLLSYAREQQMGVMAISHQVDFLRCEANRILFLHQGSITEEGGSDILVNPSSTELGEFLSYVRRSR